MGTMVITGASRGIGLEIARVYTSSLQDVVVGVITPSQVVGVGVSLIVLDVLYLGRCSVLK